MNSKDFFLSQDNISIINSVIIQNFLKRNYKFNKDDPVLKDRLNKIQVRIMNLIYDSKDYYLEIEDDIHSSPEVIKILYRKKY